MDPKDAEKLAACPIADLIADPLTSDHVWFRNELRQQIEMAERLEVDQARHMKVPIGLGAHLRRLLELLSQHCDTEDLVVFPSVLAGRGMQGRETIKSLELEHLDVAAEMEHTRRLTTDLQAPANASQNWHGLYASILAFETRMRRHSHIEYSILFPRVLCGEDASGGPEDEGA